MGCYTEYLEKEIEEMREEKEKLFKEYLELKRKHEWKEYLRKEDKRTGIYKLQLNKWGIDGHISIHVTTEVADRYGKEYLFEFENVIKEERDRIKFWTFLVKQKAIRDIYIKEKFYNLLWEWNHSLKIEYLNENINLFQRLDKNCCPVLNFLSGERNKKDALNIVFETLDHRAPWWDKFKHTKYEESPLGRIFKLNNSGQFIFNNSRWDLVQIERNRTYSEVLKTLYIEWLDIVSPRIGEYGLKDYMKEDSLYCKNFIPHYWYNLMEIDDNIWENKGEKYKNIKISPYNSIAEFKATYGRRARSSLVMGLWGVGGY